MTIPPAGATSPRPGADRTPVPTVTMRPLVPADLDALLVLQREGAVNGLGHLFPQQTHPFPTDDIRAQWSAEMENPKIDCFAGIDGGELVGFAATKGNELLHFGTAVATWGSGVAGELHDLVVEHLRGRGFATAWLKVLQGNDRAIAFYTRRGWRDTGVLGKSDFPPYPALHHLERQLL